MQHLCDDLDAEHEALDEMVRDLDESRWGLATPAADWAIRDQISHLWFFDRKAVLALTDTEAFAADREHLLSAGVDLSVEPGRSMSGSELLAGWRRDRVALSDAARQVEPSTRVPWYGPSMAARSFITARLMETWAHGCDIADTLGRTPPVSARLRHIAHIGVRARPYAYMVNGLDVPATDVRVELAAPDGDIWSWGDDPDVSDLVRGTALDFCLVVTQRRHMADTALEITGDAARQWMGIAQAFAGPPGGGREPGQFDD
jgi:uncharacterized protein (TIGR03084 family)